MRPAAPPARSPLLQRQCACGGTPGLDGECAACKAKRLGFQRRAATPVAPAFAPPIVHAALNGPSRPLEAGARAALEPRLGHDFSRVRVHTDATAAESARVVNAAAYTVGRQIVFAAGRYAPEGAEGRRLLAHELAHVAQQGDAPVPDANTPIAIGAPWDRQEHEAEHVAARAVSEAGAADSAVAGATASEREASRASTQAVAADGATALARPAGPATLRRQVFDIPIFDELDPCLIVPKDLPPPFDLLGGQKACGSTAKAIRDFLRGKKKAPDGKADCRGFLGFTPGGSKEFLGQCCHGVESKENCCPPDRIGFKELSPRCCADNEVVADGTCVKGLGLPDLPPLQFCLPAQKTLDGQCCQPPLVPQGMFCVQPPDKPTPPPAPAPLPSAIEIFFQFDRPTATQTGSAGLRASATSTGLAGFDSLVAQLKADPALRVQLVGRASPEGSDEYNLALAGRRATLVAEALEAAGVGGDRVADPPEADLRTECRPLRTGVVTCGEAGGVGSADRQVLARVFSTN